MLFRLLGQPELWMDGASLDLGPPKQQTVLVALLLAARQPLAVGALIDRVWVDKPPAGAPYTLATYISRLRRILGQTGAVEINNRGGAYVLHCDPQAVDVFSFRRLVQEARRAARDGDVDVAAKRYDAALQLWRGAALAGLSGAWVADTANTLDRERREAQADRIECLLRLGRLAPALDDLSRLVVEHPDDELLAEQHLRALHARGRTAEAIGYYHALRRRLADDLGVDPCVQLQRTYLWLLRSGRPETEPPDTQMPIAPAQLPADVPTFTGRADHMLALDELLKWRHDGATTAVVAIAGTAGVGKTALAVHWAHRVRDKFPDGQLFVNLRGFGPTGSAMSPGEAVRGFLVALGAAPSLIPPHLQAQIGLYRSMVAGCRVLIMLDNARDAEQVRPLLPGSPGCFVVVTSRNQMTGLTATDGAQPIDLDLLSAVEARALLRRRLGAGRIAAEPEAVDRIVTGCAQLPLALAIVAARATHRRTLPLAVLADQLGEAGGDLDAFDDKDAATNLRAVFSWSYRTLHPRAARLFRLFGLHPAPDLSAPAMASLAGIPRPQADRALAELTRAHLLAEHQPGRFSMHDLLRAYATELATSTDSEVERHAAIHRAFDHHLHTAYAAALLLNPTRDTIGLTEPQAGVVPEGLAHSECAMAWFSAERPALFAAIDLASTAGFALHACQLAWTGRDYLQRSGHRHDWVRIQHAAVHAARQLNDPVRLAHAYRSLGWACAALGEYEDAHQHLSDALDIYRSMGDKIGQAQTHRGVANVMDEQARHAEALIHVRAALALFRAVGHRAGEASCLNSLGWHGAHLGAYPEALTHCERALTIHQEIGHRPGEAAAWDSLGYVHHRLDDLATAVTCYQRALDGYGSVGDRLGEAATLVRLGEALRAAKRPDEADRAWVLALAILDQLDHPDADKVRTRLGAKDTVVA